MLTNRVNGKRINKPAGYDSFDYSKKQISRGAQVAKGENTKGLDVGAYQKSSLGDLFKRIRDFKEKGIPLEDVLIIKAENGRDNEELTH